MAEVSSMLTDVLAFISLTAAPPGGGGGTYISDKSSGYQLSNALL